MKRLMAVMVAAAALAACSEDPVEQNGEPRLTISADSFAVDVGASALVSVTVSNTSEPAQFISRNTSVATVNANGAVSGVAVGTTYVVATLSNRADVRDSVRIRVKTAPISVDPCPLLRPNFGGPATAADRALFAYDTNAPLNLQKSVRIANAVVELSSISYSSPDGGSVTGIMAVPLNRTGLRPGIVIMHPSGNPTSPVGVEMEVANAMMYAASGAVVIAIDAPFVRRGGTATPLHTAQDRDELIQLTKDLQRAVDVLLARANIDPARIAFTGYSYGAMIGAQFVGVERRLKAAVLTTPPGGHVMNSTTPANLNFFGNLSCATRSAWFQAMIPVEPIRFVANAAPTSLLIQVARFDQAVPFADASAVASAASSPKDVRIYDAGHSLNLQAWLDRDNWLSQQIGIDPPPAQP